jgi:hypothetical protein
MSTNELMLPHFSYFPQTYKQIQVNLVYYELYSSSIREQFSGLDGNILSEKLTLPGDGEFDVSLLNLSKFALTLNLLLQILLVI